MAYNDDHTYIPTEWVDDMEPPIDAEHLNKIEQALKKNGESLNEMAEAIGEGGQLKANGFVYVDKIETGIEPAPDPTLDADKPGGKLPEEYALRAELNSATPVTQGDYFEFAKGNYIAVAGLTNAPNSTDAFFVRVTVDGTQKILQAMDLATLQEFTNYYNGSVWTGWIEPSTRLSTQYLTTSILDWAVNIHSGKYGFSLGGDSYTGNDLPSGTYWKYGNGIVIKRDKTNGTLLLFDNSGNFQIRALVNGVWSDWDSVVMNNSQSYQLTNSMLTGTIYFERQGNIVCVNSSGDITPTENNTELLLGTLPSGFFPKNNIRINNSDGTGSQQLIITVSGQVSVWATGANRQTYRWCFSYYTP